MLNKNLLSIALPIILIAFSACTSSNIKVNDFPKTADPSQEITRVEDNLKKAQANQTDLLAPSHFKSAQKYLDEAKEARSKNSDQISILHEIALSQAYLEKANEITQISNQLLASVAKKRQDAVDAGAKKYYTKELASTDEDFKSAAQQIENNDTSKAEKVRAKLEKTYSDLELNSMKQAKIGPAKANLKIALNEGAKELAPETLAWAEAKIQAGEKIIENDRNNSAEVEKASSDSIAASNKLILTLREAKVNQQKTPEQLAKQSQAARQNVSNSNQKLSNVAGDLAVTDAENNKLKAQAWLDEKYENARHQFNQDEAEVYKQGNKLLIRLKGLSFKTAHSEISSNNYTLLSKVQAIAKDFGPANILVEGHTDSTGTNKINLKLSSERAHAVEAYLISNNTISPDHITSEGFADNKPLASNKTAEGRAQNRRVDVIVTPEKQF